MAFWVCVGEFTEQKNAAKAKKARAKGNTEKAKKYERRSKKWSKFTNNMAGKDAVKYTENESLGKSIAKSILFGSYGAMKYNQMRSQTKTKRGKAAVLSYLYGVGDAASAHTAGWIDPIAQYGNDRKKGLVK